MSEHVETPKVEMEGTRKVWDVSEFARRFRLDKEEEARLLRLFGPFATECELMNNAQRAPRWR